MWNCRPVAAILARLVATPLVELLIWTPRIARWSKNKGIHLITLEHGAIKKQRVIRVNFVKFHIVFELWPIMHRGWQEVFKFELSRRCEVVVAKFNTTKLNSCCSTISTPWWDFSHEGDIFMRFLTSGCQLADFEHRFVLFCLHDAAAASPRYKPPLGVLLWKYTPAQMSPNQRVKWQRSRRFNACIP